MTWPTSYRNYFVLYGARDVCSHGIGSNPGDVLRWRARPAGTDLKDHHRQTAVLTAESLLEGREGLFSLHPNSFQRHCGATFPEHTAGQAAMSYEQPGQTQWNKPRSAFDMRYTEQCLLRHTYTLPHIKYSSLGSHQSSSYTASLLRA